MRTGTHYCEEPYLKSKSKSVKFENKGTIINDGSFTITKKFGSSQ